MNAPPTYIEHSRMSRWSAARATGAAGLLGITLLAALERSATITGNPHLAALYIALVVACSACALVLVRDGDPLARAPGRRLAGTPAQPLRLAHVRADVGARAGAASPHARAA